MLSKFAVHSQYWNTVEYIIKHGYYLGSYYYKIYIFFIKPFE